MGFNSGFKGLKTDEVATAGWLADAEEKILTNSIRTSTI